MKTISIIQVTVVAMLAFFSIAVQAKDVSAQQAGVEYARQEVEKADIQLKSSLKDVAEAEKLLEQRKKEYDQQTRQLANDRKNAELSKLRLQEANAKFSKAQSILDKAWKD